MNRRNPRSSAVRNRLDRAKRQLSLTIAVLACANVLYGADYFLKPSGDDGAAGTSPRLAWRSIERVNRTRFQPGDRILFQARKSFAGNLLLTAEDAGASNAPVVITSFGKGRATLFAGNGFGVKAENAGDILVSNLIVSGSGSSKNSACGIVFDNQRGGQDRLERVQIENVEVCGFGMFGILITGQEAGYHDVQVNHCQLHHNLRGGMEIAGRLAYDSPLYAHSKVRVSYCDAFANSGDPNYLKNHSGSGIVLYQVDGGLVEHCRAWGNGGLCRSSTGGGVGLWACAARRVTIEHCESFENRTGGKDGGGFDLDGGCSECVLQYNYSHDNDGPGLMVYTYAYASYSDRDNIVRFNISENDSRRSRAYAGLWVRSDGQGMSGIEIYNNTVRVGAWTDQAALVHGDGVAASFRNNLFLTPKRVVPLRVEAPHSGLRFENNLYWSDARDPIVQWGTNWFSSLEAWQRASGQELTAGQPAGLNLDPKLRRAASDKSAPRGVSRATLVRFKPTSQAVRQFHGVPISTFANDTQKSTDILNQPLLATNWPIGAIREQQAN